MTLTLELTPAQEAKLRAQAEALELTPDGYLKKLAGLEDGMPVQEAASEDEAPDVIPPGQSLADALAGRIGRVHSGRGDLSQDTGRKFTEILLEKRKQGRF